MDERNWVIADIPVRKGLEERYCVHVNAATDWPDHILISHTGSLWAEVQTDIVEERERIHAISLADARLA